MTDGDTCTCTIPLCTTSELHRRRPTHYTRNIAPTPLPVEPEEARECIVAGQRAFPGQQVSTKSASAALRRETGRLPGVIWHAVVQTSTAPGAETRCHPSHHSTTSPEEHPPELPELGALFVESLPVTCHIGHRGSDTGGSGTLGHSRPQETTCAPAPCPLLTPERATAASPDGRLFATVQQSEPSYQIKVWGNRSRTQLASH